MQVFELIKSAPRVCNAAEHFFAAKGKPAAPCEATEAASFHSAIMSIVMALILKPTDLGRGKLGATAHILGRGGVGVGADADSLSGIHCLFRNWNLTWRNSRAA
jgi:hypothetical protein